MRILLLPLFAGSIADEELSSEASLPEANHQYGILILTANREAKREYLQRQVAIACILRHWCGGSFYQLRVWLQ